MATKTIYRMNMSIAGFEKGDWWESDDPNLPLVVKKWAEQGGGRYGTESKPILLIEDRDPIDIGKDRSSGDFSGICPKCGYSSEVTESDNEKGSDFKTVEDLKKDPKKSDPKKDESIAKCKGSNKNGNPCKFTGSKVLENGYCIKHQDQVPKTDPEEEPENEDLTEEDSEPNGKSEIFIPSGSIDDNEKTEEGES